VATTVTSLLTLMDIEADPVTSREHILLSTLLARAWRDGQSLDLAALIQQIQTPPVTRVGVLDVEAFYPAKDRFELAMRLNNLLAAPGFRTWTEGEPLDVGRLLYTAAGKPRVSILSIAHLGDRERMFFVSLLLNEILSWVRTQPGTSSLRAIFYMDEIFGFFPPGARLRPRRPAVHAEPGGPRLQGAGEHGHLAAGPPADRARQGAGARRPGRGDGERGSRGRSLRARSHAVGALGARVPDAQRARIGARGLRDALGDVVFGRADDTG
jgi:hypothetical protein